MATPSAVLLFGVLVAATAATTAAPPPPTYSLLCACDLHPLIADAIDGAELRAVELQRRGDALAEQERLAASAARHLGRSLDRTDIEATTLEAKREDASVAGAFDAAAAAAAQLERARGAQARVVEDLRAAHAQGDMLAAARERLAAAEVERVAELEAALGAGAAAARAVQRALAEQAADAAARADLARGVRAELEHQLALLGELNAVRASLAASEDDARAALLAARARLDAMLPTGHDLMEELSELRLELAQADGLVGSSARFAEVLGRQRALALQLGEFGDAATLGRAQGRVARAAALGERSARSFADRAAALSAAVDKHLEERCAAREAASAAASALRDLRALREAMPAHGGFGGGGGAGGEAGSKVDLSKQLHAVVGGALSSAALTAAAATVAVS